MLPLNYFPKETNMFKYLLVIAVLLSSPAYSMDMCQVDDKKKVKKSSSKKKTTKKTKAKAGKGVVNHELYDVRDMPSKPTVGADGHIEHAFSDLLSEDEINEMLDMMASMSAATGFDGCLAYNFIQSNKDQFCDYEGTVCNV